MDDRTAANLGARIDTLARERERLTRLRARVPAGAALSAEMHLESAIAALMSAQRSLEIARESWRP